MVYGVVFSPRREKQKGEKHMLYWGRQEIKGVLINKFIQRRNQLSLVDNIYVRR